MDIPAAPNAQMSAWMQSLATTGRIEIRRSVKQYLYHLGIPAIVVMVVFLIGFMATELEPVEIVWGLIIVPLGFLIVGLCLYLRNRDKVIVLDRAGITLPNGQHIPWSEVDSADVYQSSRGGPTVRVELSEAAWTEFLRRQSAPGRGLNQLNRAFMRKRGIFLSQYLSPNPDDFASLINFFVSEERTD